LEAAYAPKLGVPPKVAVEPSRTMDAPSESRGSDFCTVNRVPRTFRSKVSV
jgi:hypothetical protein